MTMNIKDIAEFSIYSEIVAIAHKLSKLYEMNRNIHNRNSHDTNIIIKQHCTEIQCSKDITLRIVDMIEKELSEQLEARQNALLKQLQGQDRKQRNDTIHNNSASRNNIHAGDRARA